MAGDLELEEAHVRFRLGRHRYALPASLARRVQPAAGIVPVPLAPPAVVGTVNVRGRPALVVDIRVLEAAEESAPPAPTAHQHLIACEHDGADVALVVDEVEAVVHHRGAKLVPAADARPFRPPEGMSGWIRGRLVPDPDAPEDVRDPSVAETRDALRRLLAAVEAQARHEDDPAANPRPETMPRHAIPYEADHAVWVIDLDACLAHVGGRA